MPLDAKALETKFEEKSQEVKQLQEQKQFLQSQLQECDTLLKEGIGELKGYQKLFQEFFENDEDLILPEPESEE
jgi:hypothetical protein